MGVGRTPAVLRLGLDLPRLSRSPQSLVPENCDVGNPHVTRDLIGFERDLIIRLLRVPKLGEDYREKPVISLPIGRQGKPAARSLLGLVHLPGVLKEP